jgi:hypothetical protein
MRVVDILLARYIELTADGTFTVVGGGVSRINTGGFPWSWGVLFLLARLRMTLEEGQGKHMIAVECETPSGETEPVGEETQMLSATPETELGPDGLVGLNFNYCMVNLHFPKPGVYKYRLKIDGQAVGSADLLVAGPTPGDQGQ